MVSPLWLFKVACGICTGMIAKASTMIKLANYLFKSIILLHNIFHFTVIQFEAN